MHLGEARLDDELTVSTQVLAADPKRLHVFHSLRRTADDAVIATAEQMLLHVDTGAGRAAPAEGAVRAAVERLAADHAPLSRPDAAGRRVGQRP